MIDWLIDWFISYSSPKAGLEQENIHALQQNIREVKENKLIEKYFLQFIVTVKAEKNLKIVFASYIS